ncbi:MAG: 2-(1,2-epoxy-1,2-dihydrophenyl)acetyl-CoA isomerase [Rhodobacteraceae bacterium]|nr:enoyl-CoA hydratase-related protein [Paracoccaceae bacterium]MYG43000.1 2-(1,2-epoxy-1,2-dihydrophenyl)acetyl-CoA isomerase [Paracoccaceae bacterium]
MEYKFITMTIDSGIAIVKMNRPEVRNALNAEMRRELTDAIKRAESEGRVLVLTGEGNAFCSGQDLGDNINLGNADLEQTLRDEYYPIIDAIYNSRIPSIAAVNGAAAGAGANLALATDVVIAAESAYFLQAFTRIGLIPDAGGTWYLPRKIGLAKAMGASLFAERISAVEASNWGMIWEAIPDDQFEEHWLLRAKQLAEGPTLAYYNLKQAFRKTYDNNLKEQFRLEAKLQGKLGKSRDFREGIMAFVEKRLPKFEGR